MRAASFVLSLKVNAINVFIPLKTLRGGAKEKKIRSPCMTYCITDAEGECMASVIPRMESWAVGRRMIHSAWIPLSPTGVGVKLELGEGAGSYC